MLQVLPNYNTAPLSTGDQSNPAVLVADGTVGESVVQRLFLHNDEADKYYTGISLWVSPIPENWSIKLLAQKNQPTEAEWAAVSSGNTITFAAIGSAATPDLNYHPFWVRLEVPAGTETQTVLTAKLQSDFTEWSR